MKTKTMAGQILAMMVVGVFIFSSVVYADATIVDNLNMNGTANTSFGIYDDEGNLLVGQTEQVDGELNRTRVVSINTSDDELRDYVESNANDWSDDSVSQYSLRNALGQSIQYLKGEEYDSDYAKDIGDELDSYFASDEDIQVLLKYIQDLQLKSANLNFRVTSVERTLEEIASEDFCNAKLETAEKYNLTLDGLKCGLNSTYYYTVDPATNGGSDIRGIEKYDPNVDSQPIEMAMLVPSSATTGETFPMTLILNNTGTKFGFYKIVLKTPENWEASETLFSGTLADNEVKTIMIDITPGEGSGNITAYAKIVMSGKTYKLVANAKMNAKEEVIETQSTTETTSSPSIVTITANTILEVSNEIKNQLGNVGEVVKTTAGDVVTGSSDAFENFSEMVNGSGAPMVRPIITTTTVPDLGVDVSGVNGILKNISWQ